MVRDNDDDDDDDEDGSDDGSVDCYDDVGGCGW